MVISEEKTVKMVYVADENGNIISKREWSGHYNKSIAGLVGYVHLRTHVDGSPIVREKAPFETSEELKNFETVIEEQHS
jgi:hypothetical protein